MDIPRDDEKSTTILVFRSATPSAARRSTALASVSTPLSPTSSVPVSTTTSVDVAAAAIPSTPLTTREPPPLPSLLPAAAASCSAAAPSQAACTSFIAPALRCSLRSCFFFAFFFFLRSVKRFFLRARFFFTSRATSRASLDACASYLLSNASIMTAKNSVRNVNLPTMTHVTKKAADPHPAYSTVLNMMNSQSSSVSTWNTSRVL
mmetsp:Transcript_12577/g.30543  ORF Transcript_12577/g.30543 Transcript_12577/m.30543 type:complete len:206 (-) Transcript_12577:1291-1908(-)